MRTIISLLLLVAACNRGPEPKPYVAEPAAFDQAAPAPTPAQRPALTAPTPANAAAAESPTAGGVTWKAPAPFEARQPSSSMRAAEYALPAVDGEAPVLAVFFFGPGQGGSVDDNLNRWIGQFKQADGSDSNAHTKRGEQQVNGMKVTTVDLTGIFAGMSPMQAPSEPKTNQRLIGAIVEGPQGPVFFKLTGPATAIEAGRPAFEGLIQSLRPVS